MSEDRFYNEKQGSYYRHARLDALEFLPPDFASVVDVGGSSGATLSAIKARWPNAHTICLDAHAESVKTARENGHQAFVCDIEKSTPDVFRTAQVAMFLDVLEHLTDPWHQLARIVNQLPPGAWVIVSLPNVRFWEASCRLFFLGDWKLKDAGVLDRTHLRFFTRRTASQLLRGAGLQIFKVRPRLPGGRRYALMNRLSFGIFEDFLTEQYIFAARKPALQH